MKIAIIRKKYVPYGGAEKFSSDQLLQLADKGNEVHIFASHWEPIDNIHFHKVPTLRFGAISRLLSFAFAVKKMLQRETFDLIQSHERTLYQDIYRAGDGCHRQWLEKRKLFLSPLKNLSIAINPFHAAVLAIEKNIFMPGRYKKIIAISEMVKRDIQKYYAVPDENIAVIYNGVSLKKFHPNNQSRHRKAIRQQLNIPSNVPLLLTVGSGFERKGLKFLVQSMAHVKNSACYLLVLGKGNWNRYRTFAAEAVRKRMIHLPQVEDIEKYYAAADAFVLPSVYEPFGNANLEALASGLSVIVSSHSGAAELITHQQNGLILQNPGSPEEIAGHIDYLSDPEIRKEMGKQARTLAENFSQDKNTQAMLDLYAQVLKS